MKELPTQVRELSVQVYAVGKMLLDLMTPGLATEERRYMLEKQRRDFLDRFGVDLDEEAREFMDGVRGNANKGEAK